MHVLQYRKLELDCLYKLFLVYSLNNNIFTDLVHSANRNIVSSIKVSHLSSLFELTASQWHCTEYNGSTL